MTLENKVSAHEGLGALPNSLKELWFEIGGSCHLRCSYCFAESGGIDRSTQNMSMDQIKAFLNEFVEICGERVGIVGAGEPFHPMNRADTFEILDLLQPTGVKTTIFTTADLIDFQSIERLEQYPRLVLLVKYNSRIAQVQDQLVNMNGYTKRRDIIVQELIGRGFNNGRLGIVTSILEQNAKEIPEIFRFARDHHLIFDADNPIPRGRGKTCDRESIARLAKPIIEQLSKIDREEYGNAWDAHATYIASPPCTRFNQHLYVLKDGTVIPCVGSPGIVLGSVKKETLIEIWEKPITQIIRQHNYCGKCTTCMNYQEKKCFSCLGRSATDATTHQLQTDGCVKTIGCFQYRKGK